jgi:hypothetical protein
LYEFLILQDSWASIPNWATMRKRQLEIGNATQRFEVRAAYVSIFL